MKCFSATVPIARPRIPRLASPWTCMVFLLLFALSAVTVFAQEDEKAKPTPIPIEMDPNDPSLGREERIRRQRELIRLRMENLRKMEEEKKKAEAEARRNAIQEARLKEAAATQPQPVPKPVATPQPKVNTARTKKGRRPYATIFMQPSSLSVTSGKTFSTQCSILNPDKLAIDTIDLLIAFPPASLELTAIHQDDLEPLLDGEPEVAFDSEKGRLAYKARLKQAVQIGEIQLLTFVWEARTPTSSASIQLHFEGRYSGLYWGEQRQNVTSFGIADSLLGTQLRILPEGGWSGPTRIVTSSADGADPALTNFTDQSALQPPRLWIRQPNEPLLPGQWVVIEVGIDNPDAMVYDEARLVLAYDPAVIEFSDTDRYNGIKNGINVLDGPFTETWQWQSYRQNEIKPDQGRVDYWVANDTPKSFESATLFRMIGRVKRSTRDPLLRWVFELDAPRGLDTSGVWALGENVYKRFRERDMPKTDPAEALTASGDYERADPSLYRFDGE